MPKANKDYSLNHFSFACKDFNNSTLIRLKALHAALIGMEMMPDEMTDAPWSNAVKGYILRVGPLGQPSQRLLLKFHEVIAFSRQVTQESQEAQDARV